MKTPIKKVLLQTSLFIVQFSTRCLKLPSWTFFIKNQPKTDAFEAFSEISFKGSINQLFEHSDLTKVIPARYLTNFTFVLYRIYEQKFLMIFCYTELFFPRQSKSDRTLLSSRPTVQSIQENILKKFSENISQKYNCSNLKSKYTSERKCL